jgi:glutaredoxin/glutathione-dependent peroxiredoxin
MNARYYIRQFSNMIQNGASLPEFTFMSVKKGESGSCSIPFPIGTSELFKGKKAVLVAVPGAFTPVCSSQHIPEFIKKHDQLKAKGIDFVACTAANDAYVLGAWNDNLGGWGAITMLADGSGKFAKAIGAELDLAEKGMGIRSKRYALLVDNGVVKYVGVDDGPVDKSSVEAILKVA